MVGARDTEMGRVELLADAERPGGWLLTVDRIRQSYVDLDDPTYLDFEYVQAFADVLDALPAGPLAVTHVGGGACTLARYVAVTRPGSPQIVLEPDVALAATVRAHLPQTLVIADPAVVKGRRFGNLVVAAARAGLPVDDVRRSAARAAFPRSVTLGHGREAAPITDADRLRSPAPPEETWRVITEWELGDDPPADPG